ncbi:hypothetical protein P175DRAFT_0533733 [Aspergillus ochraceoroseus IBT 24754]|uniref:Uncharacterized protein n=1 Tax=Aspergillus ochraceoroseus IBT 24754 TaxID=1392256 RepID=A0A2T5LSQ7_9EURO|nr:uncharacterized protein P175DRAFT_0533733 [Aspergillus ochraceoroseus IBT 24754]PTU19301.1 hypothetical protein P175DRAFT_0533733 [Aspergillus ochraceoroseus IBT 24754]
MRTLIPGVEPVKRDHEWHDSAMQDQARSVICVLIPDMTGSEAEAGGPYVRAEHTETTYMGLTGNDMRVGTAVTFMQTKPEHTELSRASGFDGVDGDLPQDNPLGRMGRENQVNKNRKHENMPKSIVGRRIKPHTIPSVHP